MGQPFIINTRMGAGGSIGLGAAARSKPDGYNLVIGHIGGLSINPSVYASLPYDVEKDFVPVRQIYNSPLILLVAQNSPYKTVSDVLDAARARPGDLGFSSGGNGNGAHLSGELLASLTGVKMRHIPYKSTSSALIAVANGDVDFSFGNLSLAVPLIDAGKLRALGFSGSPILEQLSDVPLVSDTVPGFSFHDWSGMLAPAGTPAAIVNRLSDEITKVLANEKVRKDLAVQGLIPVDSDPVKFKAFIAAEQKKWGAVARSINLKLG
jgi:tripartite-type tricarboxylate transporter receptor subunit TctC